MMNQAEFNAALAVYASNFAPLYNFFPFIANYNTPPLMIVNDCRRQMIEEDLLKKLENQVYNMEVEQKSVSNLKTLAEVACRLKPETAAVFKPWETLLAAVELQHKKRIRKRPSCDTIDDTINNVIKLGTPSTSSAVDLSIKKRRIVDGCNNNQSFTHSNGPNQRRLLKMENVDKLSKSVKPSRHNNLSTTSHGVSAPVDKGSKFEI